MSDQHVMPGWQDHTPSAACWCQPAPQDEVIGLDAIARRVWLHRAAHDDPHRYPEPSDPALNVLGREWVVQNARQPQRARTDWSNVVVDEGDEAP